MIPAIPREPKALAKAAGIRESEWGSRLFQREMEFPVPAGLCPARQRRIPDGWRPAESWVPAVPGLPSKTGGGEAIEWWMEKDDKKGKGGEPQSRQYPDPGTGNRPPESFRRTVCDDQ